MLSKVFVGNIPWSATEESLKGFFQGFGFDVKSTKILLDHETGRSRGFGFVELNGDSEVAKEAIEDVNDQIMDGRSLRVCEAQDRSKSNGSRGNDFRKSPGDRRGNSHQNEVRVEKDDEYEWER